MCNKTYKALSKRVKVTKTGEVLKRKAGQDHFNSRENGNTRRNKRRDVGNLTKPIRNLVRDLT